MFDVLVGVIVHNKTVYFSSLSKKKYSNNNFFDIKKNFYQTTISFIVRCMSELNVEYEKN